MEYIALLRGVNVGGKNKLSMPQLKEELIRLGFSGVKTYINSGNILFTSENREEAVLKEQLEALLRGRFGIESPVALIVAPDYKSALEQAPSWWNQGAEMKHNVIFIIPPLTAQQAFAEVGELVPEYEKASYHGRVVFWSAPLKTFSHTRWAKVVGSSIYPYITIRNANTALKLLKLLGQG